MDEKQKRQLEIMHNALTDEQCDALWEVSRKLEALGRNIVSGLSAFDVIQGNSEKMMVANAVMQIRKQVDLIVTCDESN